MLQEADMGITDLAMQGQQGRFAADSQLLVKFFMHPRLHQGKTAEAGRPIYEEQPYIQIMTPGNKDSIVIRPASQQDKERFAEHYRKFEVRQEDDHIEGTLLEEWPLITRGQVEELRYFNIRTVEQLAEVADVHGQNIMGINALREKARKYLEAAAEASVTEALAEAKEQNELLQAQLAELNARMQELEEAED